jgi:hypothetical protein
MYSVQMVWNFLLPAYALDDTNFYLHLTRFLILFIPTLQCISPLLWWFRKHMEFCILQHNLSYALLFYWTSHSETITLKVQTIPISIKINKDKLNTGSAVQKMTLPLSSPTSTKTENHSLCTSLRITSSRTEIKNIIVMSNQYLTFCLMTRPDISFCVVTDQWFILCFTALASFYYLKRDVRSVAHQVVLRGLQLCLLNINTYSKIPLIWLAWGQIIEYARLSCSNYTNKSSYR